MQKVAMSIASMLRLENIPTDIDIVGRNLKKQMEQARDTKLAIIVGPDELKEGNVLLRDMVNGTEGTIPLEKLTEDPGSILNLEKP